MIKILVITPSWVGDCMLMQPMLARLKQRHPQAQIDLLAPAWCADLLRLMPEASQVIINPFPHGALQLLGRRRLGRQLREAHYDQAIVLPNSLKSALLPYFANIPVRTGYVGEMRYGLLNDVRELNKKALPLMVERFAQLAEAPNQAISRPIPQPRLNMNQAQIKQLLVKFGPAPDQPVAILCPGAEFGPSKRWPIAYFAEIAQRLRGCGYAVWLIGSAKDKEIADKIMSLGNGDCRNLCGETDLAQAAALLASADLVVSNDSGLMHLAAALDRPMIALFGSSSPDFTPPLSANARILRIDLPCSPCFKRECPLGHFNCMNQLTPDLVAKYLPEIKENHDTAQQGNIQGL